MFKRIKSWFTPKPPVELRHPAYGVLTFDSGLWLGKSQQGNKEIRFCVGGTSNSPDAGLLERLKDVLGRFTEVEKLALEFIHKQEPRFEQEMFEFYSLDFLWEANPDDFVLEFVLEGDLDGIWRVEFENGIPKSLGRDD